MAEILIDILTNKLTDIFDQVFQKKMIPPAYSDLTKPVNDLLSKDFPIGTSKLELNTTSENGVVK